MFFFLNCWFSFLSFPEKSWNPAMGRLGILLVIHVVMRARVISCGDGMHVRQRKEDPNKIAFGISMID